MLLNYDFDMVPLGGPDGAVARFRDPRTTTALAEASWQVQRLFRNAGFDVSDHNSDTPSGYYALGEHSDRQKVLRHFDRVPESAFTQQVGQAFDMRAFLANAASAQPFDPEADDPDRIEAEEPDVMLRPFDLFVIGAIFVVVQMGISVLS